MPRVDAEDPHLWLEDVLGERALEQVHTWNDRTMAAYKADPRFAAMQKQALQVLNSDERLALGKIRGKHLYNFWKDDTHVRGIWRRATLKSYLTGTPAWETVLDIDALAKAENENWIWAEAFCAPGADRCLVELSRGGTDAGVFREYSLTDKAFVTDGFFIPEGKSRVAMVDRDRVLVATDFGDEGLTTSGYPRRVAMWTRGQALDQAKILLTGELSDVAVGGFVPSHGKMSVPLVYRGRSFYEDEIWRLDEAGVPERLPIPDQHFIYGMFEGQLLVSPKVDWAIDGQTFRPGTLVALRLSDLSATPLLVPQQGEAIEAVHAGKSSVFVQLLVDVTGELRRLTPKKGSWSSTTLPMPANAQLQISGSDASDDLLVTVESLLMPVTLLHVDKKNRVRELQALPSFFDASDIVSEQRFATSSDGTRVPYFVMARKDVLEKGNAPTIQYGYGGFQNSILPTYYDNDARPQHGAFAGPLWVRDGGVLVLSNIRGGNEYGPSWHQSVLKANRQLAFDDFFAIGEALVADGVTTPEKLGAIGRSNGGLLMGVALTQRPDLYQAIDCGVPLLDMMRFHKLLAGASWRGEYGDPDVPEERKTLAAYSPYQNLKAETAYPRVLFYTSTKDDRVHPGHARKMAAALASMGVDFDYWENVEGGHGGVANQEQAALRIALEFLYFKRELGLP